MEVYKQSAKILTKNLSDAEVCKHLERVARVCYKSEDKITDVSAAPMIIKLLKAQHFSIFEHTTVSISLTTNRAIANELVRHRLASYAQESTRWIKYDNIDIVIDEFYFTEAQIDMLRIAAKFAEQAYKSLIDMGCRQQFARDILPLCTKTDIIVTANLRSWFHILNTRLSAPSHPYIQCLSELILEELEGALPTIFGNEYWKECK